MLKNVFCQSSVCREDDHWSIVWDYLRRASTWVEIVKADQSNVCKTACLTFIKHSLRTSLGLAYLHVCLFKYDSIWPGTSGFSLDTLSITHLWLDLLIVLQYSYWSDQYLAFWTQLLGNILWVCHYWIELFNENKDTKSKRDINIGQNPFICECHGTSEQQRWIYCSALREDILSCGPERKQTN